MPAQAQILVNYSDVEGFIPAAADLIAGEIFLNIFDGKSYMLDSLGAVQNLENVTPLTQADVDAIIAELKGSAPEALNDLPKLYASLGFTTDFHTLILNSLNEKEADIGSRYTAAEVQTKIDNRPASTLEATSSELVVTRLNEAVLGSWICITENGYKLASLTDGFTEVLGVVTSINTDTYEMTIITSGLTGLSSSITSGSTLYLQPDGTVSENLSGGVYEKAVGKVVTGKIMVDVNQTMNSRVDTPVGAPLITTAITAGDTVIDRIPLENVSAIQWLVCVDDLDWGAGRRNVRLIDAVVHNGAVAFTAETASENLDAGFVYTLTPVIEDTDLVLKLTEVLANGQATVRRIALGDDVSLASYESVPI